MILDYQVFFCLTMSKPDLPGFVDIRLSVHSYHLFAALSTVLLFILFLCLGRVFLLENQSFATLKGENLWLKGRKFMV
jgi:hypothetical protein